MLITNQILNCTTCGNRISLGNLNIEQITNLLRINLKVTKIDTLPLLDAYIKEGFTEATRGLDLYKSRDVYALLQSDWTYAHRVLHQILSDSPSAFDEYNNLETTARDIVADFILLVFRNYSSYCSEYCSGCSKTDKSKTLTIQKVYTVTEKRITDTAIDKMLKKMEMAVSFNTFDTLVYNTFLNQYTPLVIMNDKPYHVAVPYTQDSYLHITPYAVWFQYISTGAVEVVYDNTRERFKGSFETIRDLHQQYPYTNAFEVAYNIYNGRKPMNILI